MAANLTFFRIDDGHKNENIIKLRQAVHNTIAKIKSEEGNTNARIDGGCVANGNLISWRIIGVTRISYDTLRASLISSGIDCDDMNMNMVVTTTPLTRLHITFDQTKLSCIGNSSERKRKPQMHTHEENQNEDQDEDDDNRYYDSYSFENYSRAKRKHKSRENDPAESSNEIAKNFFSLLMISTIFCCFCIALWNLFS